MRFAVDLRTLWLVMALWIVIDLVCGWCGWDWRPSLHSDLHIVNFLAMITIGRMCGVFKP